MKRAIGMSTGALYKRVPLSKKIFEIYSTLGCTAVEIGCLRKEKLLDLMVLSSEGIRSNFSHLSLHAPTDLKYGWNYDSMHVLESICNKHHFFHFDLVVIHPESVEDWEILKNIPLPIGIENADWRKDFGKTVEDLEKVFENTDFGFVLDVNHCFTNDRTMGLAVKLIERFSGRLCEIHLSGFSQYHEPIHLTRQMEILEAVPSGNIPIIIESSCENEDEARKEFDFVRKYFNG